MKRFFILIFLLGISTLLGAQGNCVSTIDPLAKMREDEKRLDSVWRKENIWMQGLSFISNGQVIDTAGIEHPRWAKWDYDLEKYFISQMEYPGHLLEKNRSGYSVVMFSLDTLGLPRAVNILASCHKDFDKEAVRLVHELPHCLPCRDKEGKRMECLYTVYIPFLPQHYRDRVKADSIRKEELKHCFVEWKTTSCFKDGNPHAVTDYITERLTYNPELLGNQGKARGVYRAKVNSYGEVVEVDAFRSCGIQEWDDQVLKIIKGMPRWTPSISYYGKGEYRESSWVIPVIFKKKSYGKLIAHTTEKQLEAGVPVCYLNEQGDTIVPYGKYNFCPTDAVRNVIFAYENKLDARIVCLDNHGKELYYVFQYDNGPDYIREGLFRIANEDGLIGFADSLGNVVIKPQFKFAFPFEGGKAKVTVIIGEQKAMSDGEHCEWVSNEWQYINKKGELIQ